MPKKKLSGGVSVKVNDQTYGIEADIRETKAGKSELRLRIGRNCERNIIVSVPLPQIPVEEIKGKLKDSCRETATTLRNGLNTLLARMDEDGAQDQKSND